jgi:hyperosmotically inducible periplasmic protein
MRILITFAVSTALGLVGCSTTSTSANNNTNPNPGVTNSDLEQSVKSKLAADPQTATAKLDVSADASKNRVTLSGTLYSESARTEAVNDAKAAQPGLDVVDKIEVKPGEIPRTAYTQDMAREAREQAKTRGDKVGTSLEDAWIHTKIASKLVTDSETPARKINIDVQNGVVTLRGSVDAASQKADAGRIAKDTDGVKRVNNLLHVG